MILLNRWIFPKSRRQAPRRGSLFAVIQAGSVAVVLAVSTFNTFELDRFFVPKELALHLTAVMAGTLALRSISRAAMTRVDLLLLCYLLLGVLSSAMATNRWLALRARAITALGLVLF